MKNFPENLNLMLRRVIPEWDFDNMISELQDFCPKHGINEVIFMVNPEEFSEGILPLERVRQYAELLKEARLRLQEFYIKMSINVWATLNHMDRGRNTNLLFPEWTWMTDQNGVESTSTPCPLCKEWLEHISQTYAIYASSKPHIIWVDDDFRYHNHLPLEWGGCFCDLHLQEVSKALNREYTRQELVSAILAKGEPSKERKVWLEILGWSMVNAAASIQKAVHEVSPETRIGLMTSLAANHSAEGRKWYELMQALSGPHKPIARPHYGPYSDASPRDYVTGFLALKETSSCYPTDTTACPEIENIPFTIFSKSSLETAMQITTSIVSGHKNITLELYDFVGNRSDLEPAYGEMLKRNLNYWNSIAEVCPPEGIERGVGVIRRNDLSACIRTYKGEKISELVENTLDGLSSIAMLGLPICFERHRVNIGFGQVWRALSPKEIQSILGGGVVLDGVAVRTLTEMGYSHLIGVESIGCFSNLDTAASSEKILLSGFKQPASNGIMTTTYGYSYPCLFEKLQCLDEAIVVSVFMDPKRQELTPATILYENEIGGRVAVLATHHNGGMHQAGFRNWDRKVQIESMVKWAGRGIIDLFVRKAGPILVYARELEEKLIVSVTCLQPDGCRELEIVAAGGITTDLTIPQFLSSKGLLEAQGSLFKEKNGHIIFRPSIALEYLETGIWVFPKKASFAKA